MMFKKRNYIFLFLLTFLFSITFSIDAVSDLEKEISKVNVKRYTEKFGIAELSIKERARVYKIFDNLAKHAKNDAPDLNFNLYVLNAEVMNAAYLGDGQMILYKGLLDKMNDRQLAAVLAHEIGHGVNDDIQDSIDMIQKIQFGSILVNVLTDGDKNQDTANLIANISFNLMHKGYSREQERDADYYSVFLTKRAGYDPDGTVGLMKLLKGEGGASKSELAELLSTHPHPDTRIAYLSELLTKIKEGERLYPSPKATAEQVAKALVNSDVKGLYNSYSDKVKEETSLNNFKAKTAVINISNEVKSFKGSGELSYKIDFRNQVEDTARVAILFKKNGQRLDIAVDLIKTEYGWRVVRDLAKY